MRLDRHTTQEIHDEVLLATLQNTYTQYNIRVNSGWGRNSSFAGTSPMWKRMVTNLILRSYFQCLVVDESATTEWPRTN